MTTEFYKNAEIFITGGSGVLGKAAIEKLLRSCDVKKIYVLIRTRKNVSPADRLKEMKNSKIFRVLKELKPDEFDRKLIAIPGDITLDLLGVSEKHISMMRNVTIFLNLAASTRFNLPLRTAIETNLKSTQEALRLAEKFNNLKIFNYVSTFFSNPFLKHIEDKVYPAVFDWRTALKLLDPKYEPYMDAIESKLIENFPNTYVFTKHLAEQLVNDHRTKLPVTIFRPSIVTASYLEPEPGFTETMTGVMGLLSIWGTGLIQVLRCNPNAVLDLIPLDSTTIYLLVFTARAGNLEPAKIAEEIPVSKFSSWNLMRHKFRDIGRILNQLAVENPVEKSIWIPHIQMTNSSIVFWILTIFLQIIPSILIDIVLRLFGRQPIMMAIQRKIYLNATALRFFITNEISSDGATDLKGVLAAHKNTEFDMSYIETCTVDDESFKHLLGYYMKGCRKLMLNEDESSLPMCRRILKVKMFVYDIIRWYVLYFVAKFMYQRLLQ